MPKLIKLEAHKTYATEANAVKAVVKKLGDDADGLVYFIARSEDGRYFPVFVGQRAIENGIHFCFNVVA